MKRALKYRRMGLNYSEIAKLVDASKDTVGRAIRSAEALGTEV